MLDIFSRAGGRTDSVVKLPPQQGGRCHSPHVNTIRTRSFAYQPESLPLTLQKEKRTIALDETVTERGLHHLRAPKHTLESDSTKLPGPSVLTERACKANSERVIPHPQSNRVQLTLPRRVATATAQLSLQACTCAS
eukprot:2298139-Prymnesium_polylepis.1